MDKEQHELYEYARKRIKQKKWLYFHFVLLILGSLFLFIASKISHKGLDSSCNFWIITSWIFIFLLHFIKVFITDRFMNKNWEREQIDRLINLQKNKIEQLKNQTTEENPK